MPINRGWGVDASAFGISVRLSPPRRSGLRLDDLSVRAQPGAADPTELGVIRTDISAPCPHIIGAMEDLVVALDLGGTFVFALSGALVGVRHRLDLFGVLVLAFAAATAGGIARDLIIGAVPPPAIADPRYVLVPAVAGVLTFVWHPVVARLRTSILVMDGAGLALFAVSGAFKALEFGLGPVAAVLLGGLTGIGGGMVRDVLVSEVPIVLRADLYAVAALAGASVVVLGDLAGAPAGAMAVGGALTCFGLRMIGVRRGWRLPMPRDRGADSADE